MMGRGRRVNTTKKSKQHTGGFILKKAPKHDKKEAQHHDIDVMLGFDLVPFLSQEELTDIPVLDPCLLYTSHLLDSMIYYLTSGVF